MPRKPNDSVRLVPRDPPETKAERTRRLANQRFRLLKADMTRLGRLGGPSYELDEAATERLIGLLQAEFDYMVQQLRRRTNTAPDDIFAE